MYTSTTQHKKKKPKESSVHTTHTHTWKPLVERRMHIETNKQTHTPFMFISSETTNKNKNGRREKEKKRNIRKNFFD
jgi:hypothetical protein